MVVRIRLARWGRRNRPFYRIVASDARAKRDGRFIEVLGNYNPISHSYKEADHRIKRVALNVQRIKYWLSVGAQPTDTMSRLLGAAGILPPAPRGSRKFASMSARAPGLRDVHANTPVRPGRILSCIPALEVSPS